MSRPRFLVIALMLTLLASPVAALVCETRCVTSVASIDAGAGSVAENAGDCHGASETGSNTAPRLNSSHDCVQHAARPIVPSLKSASRSIAAEGATLVGILSAKPVHFAAVNDFTSQLILAPPGSSSRLIAPLRI